MSDYAQFKLVRLTAKIFTPGEYELSRYAAAGLPAIVLVVAALIIAAVKAERDGALAVVCAPIISAKRRVVVCSSLLYIVSGVELSKL